ncbi:hypothetical protein Taro_045071 [Colocasia esculenta]|uniref:Auxin-responsive protein n=1 Tax=Colocasia esculenta TaxID=4460 RepID=A0A843WW48_COLES|nr:hypothetical protein [Colocasia esculenta]
MEARAAAASEVGGLDSLIKATELRLGLPGTEDAPRKPPAAPASRPGSKRAFAEADEDGAGPKGRPAEAGADAETPPAAKAQVVGWPPIRSYRKNCLQGMKAEAAETPGAYVKVSMDGAPYLRKVGLGAFSGYRELREALEGMFKGFSLGFSAGEEGCGGSEHAITYQDKDGDWMLAGDVPWEMFTNSCKRLRIMKGCDARGLGSSP